MTVTYINNKDISKTVYMLSCEGAFINNIHVNTQHIDTFDNHEIDFSKSINVTLDANTNAISLTDPTHEGYYITQPIHSTSNSEPKLNSFHLIADYLSDIFFVNQNSLPKLKFYIVTPNGDEFAISHKTYNKLSLLKDIEYFKLKCILIPSAQNESPQVFGHCVHYKDYGVFNQNTTNI